MHLQPVLIHLQVTSSTLEAFTLAAIILILAVAIILCNVIIIATLINFRGECDY